MNARPPGSWELPQVFHDRLGQDAGRQRTMAHDGHLLVILHEVPQPGIGRPPALFFWRRPDGRWRSSVSGAGIGPITDLLGRYEHAIVGLDHELAEADEAADHFRVLKRATPLRRAADNMRLALQAAREAVTDKVVITLRDRASEIDRACELLVEDARHALDYAIAKQAEEQNRTSQELAESAQQLNRLMALFVPLTAATSLFSMKLDSGLDTSSTAWFWGVVGVGLALGLWFTRRPARRAELPCEDVAPAAPLPMPRVGRDDCRSDAATLRPARP
ncbi:MAG: hypothetical protein RIF41_08495 [Polyangiaceae bacterium]